MRTIKVDLPRIILEFVLVVVFIFAIYLLRKQGMNISEILVVLGVFAFASFRLLPSVVKIIKSFQTIKYNLPVLDLVFGELKDVKKISESKNKKVENNFEFQNLRFKNLDYSYFFEQNEKKVLSDINFTIEKKIKLEYKVKLAVEKQL